MQPLDHNGKQATVETRFRTIRTLWFGLFASVALYYLVTLYTGNPHEDARPNHRLLMVLAAVALLLAMISLLIKHRYLKQSVDDQRVELVQTGYVVAWALTEVGALLGLLDFFLTGNRHYYVLFIIAAAGHLLNFPRRQHLQDASFKSPTF